MIKYMAESGRITAVEIAGETAKQVILLASKSGRIRRENKVSGWRSWHDTWEDAHAFLVAEAELKVDSLRLQLEQAKGRLGQIKGMRSQE